MDSELCVFRDAEGIDGGSTREPDNGGTKVSSALTVGYFGFVIGVDRSCGVEVGLLE